MQYTNLGPFEGVSRLTLGAAGLGHVWGETTDEEAHSTLDAALDAGINLIDCAPIYGTAETLLAKHFKGKLPDSVRITTKCFLGNPDAGTAGDKITRSLEASLKAMNLDTVDVFFLHNFIAHPNADIPIGRDRIKDFVTPWDQYVDEVIPTFEALKSRGLVKAWAITGTGVPTTIREALKHDQKPDIVQAIANLMDSPGALKRFAEPASPRETIQTAVAEGIGVMGIRAVQAGALTDTIDRPLKDTHPESKDFARAAPFRMLCAKHGMSAAATAHRYALDIAGVDTVVLGVKNRTELMECVGAEAAGPLPADLRAEIDSLGLANE